MRPLDGNHGARPAPRLTPRERQVLSLLVSGKSTKEVARRLRLSPRTVSEHVGAIVRKLGARNRVQAIVFALRDGFVPAPPAIDIDDARSRAASPE